MVHFICDRCQRPLEVDDDLAGQRVACPHCAQVNVAPAPKNIAMPPGVPVARPATGPAGESRAGSSREERLDLRLTQLGLPPASGSEVTVCVVHPATIRARPGMGSLLLAVLVGGAGLTGYGLLKQVMPMWIGGGVLLLTGAAWLAVWKIHALGTALVLTNKRAVERRGILAKRTTECVYDRVQDIEIKQTFWQRLLNVGTLGLDTSAEDGVEIELEDLPDPASIRKIVDAYRGL